MLRRTLMRQHAKKLGLRIESDMPVAKIKPPATGPHRLTHAAGGGALLLASLSCADVAGVQRSRCRNIVRTTDNGAAVGKDRQHVFIYRQPQ